MAPTELVILQDGSSIDPSDRLKAAMQAAVDGIEAAESENTKSAYCSDEAIFCKFAEAFGLSSELPMSMETLAAWLGDMKARGLKLSTINRRRAWVSKVHAGQDSNPAKHPQIVRMIQGWSRTSPKAKGKRAFTPSMIQAAWDILSTRDRAMVAVAFVTGVRASELIALSWDNVESHDKGRVIFIERGKTDQTGLGRYVALPRNTSGGHRCPVKAIEAWRVESGGEGLAFAVTRQTVSNLAKRVAKLAGEDPTAFAAHSFRAGMITTASKAGVSLPEIMQQSGHESMIVALGYVRHDKAADNEAGAAVSSGLSEDKD